MIKSAGMGKEILVTVKNKIGVLADMCRIVADHGINIEAVSGWGKDPDAKIRFVTADNLRALDALKKAGYTSIEEVDVLLVELDNKPGALKNVTSFMAAQGIDIKYAYGTACSGGCPSKLVLSTSNNEKALLVLKR